MYHSYARVTGWVRAPETISSISSLKVSSLPSLIASSFTQEIFPFMLFSFARRSACGPGQTGAGRGAALDDRRAGALFQYEASNLVLASEPDPGFPSCVFEKAVEHSDATGVARDTIVQADHHHPSPPRTLLVQLI